jgi:hypothetical protein
MKEDHCGNIHRQLHGRSDKANAIDNQNADFQEGYAWGRETFAYNGELVLKAEIAFRAEFNLSANGFNEFKRGFWAARTQISAAGIRKHRIPGDHSRASPAKAGYNARHTTTLDQHPNE